MVSGEKRLRTSRTNLQVIDFRVLDVTILASIREYRKVTEVIGSSSSELYDMDTFVKKVSGSSGIE